MFLSATLLYLSSLNPLYSSSLNEILELRPLKAMARHAEPCPGVTSPLQLMVFQASLLSVLVPRGEVSGNVLDPMDLEDDLLMPAFRGLSQTIYIISKRLY